MIITNLELSIFVALVVGAASAYLGAVMVLKRMALVGDALSHVALPGIGIALTYNINPFLGAFTALAISVLLIWHVQRTTTLPVEAIVGVIFTLSLAIGLLITPEPELLEALFGNIATVTMFDAVLAVVLSSAVVGTMAMMQNKLLLGLISADLAKTQKIRIEMINLVFLILVAIVVALGVKVVGTLLMGSLVIIPAVAAKNFASNFKRYSMLSMLLGFISGGAGVLLATSFGTPPGPIVVLVAGFLFLLSLVFKRM